MIASCVMGQHRPGWTQDPDKTERPRPLARRITATTINNSTSVNRKARHKYIVYLLMKTFPTIFFATIKITVFEVTYL
jgi:hypothetical protein